jgi:hypothetical protein
LEFLNTARREIITKFWPYKKYEWNTVMKRELALKFKGKRLMGRSLDVLKQNGLARCQNTSRKEEKEHYGKKNLEIFFCQ